LRSRSVRHLRPLHTIADPTAAWSLRTETRFSPGVTRLRRRIATGRLNQQTA